jgi:hypothetical protein
MLEQEIIFEFGLLLHGQRVVLRPLDKVRDPLAAPLRTDETPRPIRDSCPLR